MTIWMSDRGWFARSSEGESAERREEARAFEEGEGRPARGRRFSSNVAVEGSSDWGRTSIGPEREAMADVVPVVMMFGQYWLGR
jgi:hypothetical protein